MPIIKQLATSTTISIYAIIMVKLGQNLGQTLNYQGVNLQTHPYCSKVTSWSACFICSLSAPDHHILLFFCCIHYWMFGVGYNFHLVGPFSQAGDRYFKFAYLADGASYLLLIIVVVDYQRLLGVFARYSAVVVLRLHLEYFNFRLMASCPVVCLRSEDFIYWIKKLHQHSFLKFQRLHHSPYFENCQGCSLSPLQADDSMVKQTGGLLRPRLPEHLSQGLCFRVRSSFLHVYG